MSDDRLQNIIDTVDTIFIRHEHGELLSDRDINSVIDDIGILFDDNAKNVFGTKSSLSQDNSNVRSKQHHGLTTNVEPVERLFMKQERYIIYIRLMLLVII